jgi:hypothetical protein
MYFNYSSAEIHVRLKIQFCMPELNRSFHFARAWRVLILSYWDLVEGHQDFRRPREGPYPILEEWWL